MQFEYPLKLENFYPYIVSFLLEMGTKQCYLYLLVLFKHFQF